MNEFVDGNVAARKRTCSYRKQFERDATIVVYRTREIKNVAKVDVDGCAANKRVSDKSPDNRYVSRARAITRRRDVTDECRYADDSIGKKKRAVESLLGPFRLRRTTRPENAWKDFLIERASFKGSPRCQQLFNLRFYIRKDGYVVIKP